jgi:hypothetical protein
MNTPRTSASGSPDEPLDMDQSDINAFVDLVREMRSAQIRAAGAPVRRDAKLREMERLLDEWLLGLGRPPTLPVVWSDDEEQYADSAADAAEW